MKDFRYEEESPSSPSKSQLKKNELILSPSTSFTMKKKILSSPYQTPSRSSVRPLSVHTGHRNSNVNNTSILLNKSTSKPSLNSTMTLDQSMFGNEDKVPMKVYLRIRPLSKEEQKQKESNCFNILSKNTVSIKSTKNTDSENRFSFNSVFPTTTTQFELFNFVTYPLIQSFLNGHNILLLSYGVTNAGKTYTISGNDQDPGIIPRALELIFKSIPKQCLKRNDDDQKNILNDSSQNTTHQYPEEFDGQSDDDNQEDGDNEDNDSEMEDDSSESVERPHITIPQTPGTKKMQSISMSDQYNYSVWLSYYEIYKKSIYDLLDDTNRKTKPSLKLETNDKAVTIQNLKEVLVTSAEDARDVIEQGEACRRVGGTKLNKTSSRSHAVLTVKVFAYPTDIPREQLTPQMLRISKMTIIDLAGCERASRTEATGDRLKEASNINTSLFILGKCIEGLKQQSLSGKTQIIPWRESDLTRICQEYFVGNGKAAMIVNVSPTEKDSDETLNVLRFSASAKEITTNSKIKQIPAYQAPPSFQAPPPSYATLNQSQQQLQQQNSKKRKTIDLSLLNNQMNEIKKRIHLDATLSQSTAVPLKDNNNILNIQKQLQPSIILPNSNISTLSRNSIAFGQKPLVLDYNNMEKDQLVQYLHDNQKKLFDYEIKFNSLNVSLREEMHKENMRICTDMENQFAQQMTNETKMIYDQFQSKLKLIKTVNQLQCQKLQEQISLGKSEMSTSKMEIQKLQEQLEKTTQIAKDLKSNKPKTPVKSDHEWIMEITEIQCDRDQLQNRFDKLVVDLEQEREKNQYILESNQKEIQSLSKKIEDLEEQRNHSHQGIDELNEKIQQLEYERLQFIREIETYQKQRDLELREMRESLEAQYQESREKLEYTHRLENHSLQIQLNQEKKEKQSLQEDLVKWKHKAEESTAILNSGLSDKLKDKPSLYHHGIHGGSSSSHGVASSPFKALKSLAGGNNNGTIFTTPMKSKVVGKIALLNEGVEQNTLYKGDVEKSVTGQGFSVRFKDTEVIPNSPLAPGTPSTISCQTPDRLMVDPNQYNDNGLLMKEINEDDIMSDLLMNDPTTKSLTASTTNNNVSVINIDEDIEDKQENEKEKGTVEESEDDWLDIDIRGPYGKSKTSRPLSQKMVAPITNTVKTISKSANKLLKSKDEPDYSSQSSTSSTISQSASTKIPSTPNKFTSITPSTPSKLATPVKPTATTKSKSKILTSVIETPKKLVNNIMGKSSKTTTKDNDISPVILIEKPPVKVAKTRAASGKAKVSPVKVTVIPTRSRSGLVGKTTTTTTTTDDTKTTVIKSTRRKLTPKTPEISISDESSSSTSEEEVKPIKRPTQVLTKSLRRRSQLKPPSFR
ncbi:kinesin family member 12 [Tieghemostelium lacteum]|uniref:Kinesin family member 12 n=1 Tax=Tieghemostelium lacteum TaxID=361077 RepID=A0A152A5X8_TIELA|nr:kinesin family member 12 [Tieghemostelium lacteum]|eukprot:KYR01628.1 kinesin family member 12 [Tieghemostelium lacteum]